MKAEPLDEFPPQTAMQKDSYETLAKNLKAFNVTVAEN